MVVAVVVVVEDGGSGGGGFSICKVKQSRASGTKGPNVHNMGCRKSVSCFHKLLHVTLPRLAP